MTRIRKSALVTGMVCSAQAAQAAGFPQLDTTWYPNQLFWLVVTFAVLYAIVSLFIAPSIGDVLATRTSAINDAIREAERAKATAESTKHNAESANLAARNNAAAVLTKAQADTNAEAADALSKLDHDLDRKLTQADVRIEETKAKAMTTMNAATASLASAMATKLLGQPVSAADVEPIVTRLRKAS